MGPYRSLCVLRFQCVFMGPYIAPIASLSLLIGPYSSLWILIGLYGTQKLLMRPYGFQ